MTLSEIRRRVDALKRRFARELTLIKARRAAEAIANDWDCSQPPEPLRVVGRFTDAGIRSHALANLHHYLDESRRKAEIPNPAVMVRKMFPWAWDRRYDNFFAFDLPPDPSIRPAIPNWCR